MIREVTVAIGLSVLIVIGTGMAAAQVVQTPNWFIQIPQYNVTYGDLLLVDVYGPPNGTFWVTLSSEPFNSSVPVFQQEYQEPAVNLLPNGTASGEVRINTTFFDIGGLKLNVFQADGAEIGSALVFIGIGGSTSVLQAEITQLQYDLEENATRLLGLLYQQGHLENDLLYTVITATVLFAIEIFLIVFTRTAAQESRLGRKLVRIGSAIASSGPGYIESTGPFTVERKPPHVDIDKFWVANQCGICDLPHNRPDLLKHLMGPAHRMNQKEAESWIRVDPEARRRMQDYLGRGRMERTARVNRVKPSTPTLDLTDLLGS
jgi:hypothetical protein